SGLLCGPVNHAKQLPNGRAAQVIILFTIREACGHTAPSRHAERSIMTESLVRKRLCFPSLLPRRCYCNPANPPTGVGHVASNLFKALTSEKLAPTGHMILTLEAISG